MVAFGMNGEPLPREHGFPVRLVTPGLYGFVGATKWLERLTLTTYDAREAYWTKRKWAIDAPIKLSSRVDTPRPLSTIDAGQTVIGGVAWAQPDGVAKVEVRLDGGDWQEAKLGPSGGRGVLAPVVPALEGRRRAATRSPYARPTARARPRPPPGRPRSPTAPAASRKSSSPSPEVFRSATNPIRAASTESLSQHQSTTEPADNERHHHEQHDPPSAPASRPSRSPCRWAWLPAAPTTPRRTPRRARPPRQSRPRPRAPAPPRAASSAPAAQRSRRRVPARSRACPPPRSPPLPAPTRC